MSEPIDSPDTPRERDLREKLQEAIEYTETVDALLDGIIPARKDPKDPTSAPLWLKDRVQMLIDQNESAAEKLSDCWIVLDEIARQIPSTPIGKKIAAMIKAQNCPAWRGDGVEHR